MCEGLLVQAAGAVALPGVAGQVGQPLEGDRQVAAVGGVAGLVVGELPPDVEGLLVQVAGAVASPGLAGQVGQPLEGDRQVAAVGGVAGLVVGEFLR